MQKIQEGNVRIFIYPGKVSKKLKVFYNEEMRLNRDISTLVFRIFARQAKKTLTVSDILAATGIRGLRYAKEADIKLILNDLNPSAIKLMKRNVLLNRVKAQICNEDANVLLSKNKHKLDVIDIDPFGSPIDFIDSASRAISKEGLLAITATDTAPLSGTYPKTCLRRYGSKPLRGDIGHEVGVRILFNVLARELAKYDRAMTPLLCLGHKHYFRIWAKVKFSKAEADKGLANIGYIIYCRKCGFRAFSKNCVEKCMNCGAKLDFAGPLWTGKIFDSRICSSLIKESGNKIINQIYEESRANALFYDVHGLCKKYRCRAVPKVETVIEKLRKKGFEASRTHFLPTAVRTNADVKAILKSFG